VTIVLCRNPDSTRVPSGLRGGTQEAAEDALRKADLVPEIDEVNNELEAGRVVRVEKEGEQVKPGTKITVEISRGNLTEVPSVVGLKEDAARAVLQNRGFTKIKVDLSDEQGTPGTVVRQTPDAKQKKSKNTEITLTVIRAQEPDPNGSGSPQPSQPPDGGGGGDDDDGTTNGLLN
jgi:serine/threonine-protein kinase